MSTEPMTAKEMRAKAAKLRQRAAVLDARARGAEAGEALVRLNAALNETYRAIVEAYDIRRMMAACAKIKASTGHAS